MDIVKIICALFVPPVAAYLQVGLTLHFFISIALTLFFYLPGIIHALWLVVTKKTS